MTDDTKAKIITAVTIGIIIIGILAISHEPPIFQGEPEYTLKAPKEDILKYKPFKKTKCVDTETQATSTTKTDCKETIEEEMVEYLYNTGIEAPPIVHQSGLEEDMSRRTESFNYFFKEKTAETETYIFRSNLNEPFYEKDGKWYKTKTARATLVDFEKDTKVSFWKGLIIKDTFAAIDSSFSGAGDGMVGMDFQATWDIAHDIGSGANADATGHWQGVFARESSGTYGIQRVFLPFDSSGIPADATVSSSTIYVFRSTAANFDRYVGVFETSQPDHTTLTNADIDALTVDDPTVIADRVNWLNGVLTGTTFSIYATSTSVIKKSGEASTCGTALTGWTCLGLRIQDDIDDTTPAGGEDDFHGIWFSEEETTALDPYIEAEYSVAVLGEETPIEIIFVD